MKKDIHPEYVDCTVTCTCGNTFQTRSTKSELVIDICNACHPFFTGTQKLIDTGGRVQRFANKFGSATEAVAAARGTKRRLQRLLRLLKQKQQRRLSVKLRLQQRLLVLLSTQRRLRLKLQRLQKLQPKKQQKLLQRKLLLRHLLKPQKTLQNNKAFS